MTLTAGTLEDTGPRPDQTEKPQSAGGIKVNAEIRIPLTCNRKPGMMILGTIEIGECTFQYEVRIISMKYASVAVFESGGTRRLDQRNCKIKVSRRPFRDLIILFPIRVESQSLTGQLVAA